MARPKKQVVDYFPHESQSGRTLFILENRWGNDGYAFWFKLLETLCQSNGHVYDYANPSAREFLLAKTKVSEDTAMDILAKLAELGKIDPGLWEYQKIWCQNLVDNVSDAYKKRKDAVPEKPSFCENKTLSSEFPPPETSSNGVSGDGSAQSILNNIILNKSILNETILNKNINNIPDDATESERLILNYLKNICGYPLDYQKDLLFIRELSIDFPKADILEKIKEWNTWLSNHPLTKKSNARLQIRNWIKPKDWAKRGANNGTNQQSTEEVPRKNKYAEAKLSGEYY